MQLRSITRALRYAAHDGKIKGMLLLGNLTPSGYGSGYAAMREVRPALGDFRASGKPVKAYLDYATTKDFYLASVANEVVLDPYGMIIMPGLASEPMVLRRLREIRHRHPGDPRRQVQVVRREPFTRKDMSPENREQLQKLLDDVWGSLSPTSAKLARDLGRGPSRRRSTPRASSSPRPR
jgi:protease-4